MFKKFGFTLAEGTPCIDNETARLLHPSGLAMTKASCHCEEQRDEAIHKKVAFTKPSRATSECNERETDNYARMNILANWRRWRLLRGAVAFTLAEVLITLAIIGVVAAITIPGLVTKINDKVKSTRITTIEKKLYQGTDKLMVLGHINGYETTEEFVKALSEHMKISTFCSADRIADCFPYDKINVEGETGTVNVADLKTPEAFGLDGEKYSNPVSFITGDGTPYIISYKKDCAIDDGNGRANSAACIAGIYDWNGARVPNKFSNDIQYLGNVVITAQTSGGSSNAPAAPIVQTDGDLSPSITSGNKTYTKFKVVDGGGLDYCGADGNQTCGTYTNGLDTCTDTTYDSRGSSNSRCSNNKWAAAKKKCKDLGLELPDQEALRKVSQQTTSNTVLNEKLGMAVYFKFWSSTPSPYDSISANSIEFTDGDLTRSSYVDSDLYVICLGE